MFNQYYSTKMYQAEYLQERQRAFQDAYADGEMIIEWLLRVLFWIRGGLVAWGNTFYQSNEYLGQQDPQQPSIG